MPAPDTGSEQGGTPGGDRLPVRDLLYSVGSNRFEDCLTRFVHDRLRPDHVYVFRWNDGQCQVASSRSTDGSARAESITQVYLRRQLWRSDGELMRGVATACEAPSLFLHDADSLHRGALRSFRQQMGLSSRAMVVGRGQPHVIGLSMVWDSRPAPSDCHGDVEIMLETGFPALVKHIEISTALSDLRQRVSCVDSIERNLKKVIGARRHREAQVGAHLLHGDSAAETAARMGIGRETVVDHRKRLYEHLDVDNSRDLLLWYLARDWSD